MYKETTFVNAQAKRTHRWIKEALIELLKEKDFHDISISELAKKADISRASFYLHYKSKEDVIYSIINDIITEALTKIKSLTDANDIAINTITCQSYLNHREFLIILGDQNLFHFWFESCFHHIINNHELVINQNELAKYYIYYHGYGHMLISYHLMKDFPDITANELLEHINNISSDTFNILRKTSK